MEETKKEVKKEKVITKFGLEYRTEYRVVYPEGDWRRYLANLLRFHLDEVPSLEDEEKIMNWVAKYLD